MRPVCKPLPGCHGPSTEVQMWSYSVRPGWVPRLWAQSTQPNDNESGGMCRGPQPTSTYNSKFPGADRDRSSLRAWGSNGFPKERFLSMDLTRICGRHVSMRNTGPQGPKHTLPSDFLKAAARWALLRLPLNQQRKKQYSLQRKWQEHGGWWLMLNSGNREEPNATSAWGAGTSGWKQGFILRAWKMPPLWGRKDGVEERLFQAAKRKLHSGLGKMPRGTTAP